MAPYVLLSCRLKIDAAPFGLCYDPEKNNGRKESVRWLIMSPLTINVKVGPPVHVRITHGLDHAHTNRGVGVSPA